MGMVRKKSVLLASTLVGMSLLLTRCGDDLEAVVPLTGTAVASGETLETQESASTEESNKEEVIFVDEQQDQECSLPEEITITISAAGDCSLGNHHEQDYYYSFNQAYDKAEDSGYFFANVKEIFEADDMTIVNLEGVFTESDVRQPERTYNIKGDPSYVGILTAGSVEAVSMGNNHRLDYGVSGSNDTVVQIEIVL